MRIAIAGKMTSGKSLITNQLVAHYGFTEVSFAAKVKEIAAELFPKANFEKDRWLLIQVGEKLRELDTQVWIKYVLPDIVPDSNIVVSDLRYPQEYTILKRLDFILVRMYVSREQQIKMIRKMYPTMPLVLIDDYSETALDYNTFDYTIDNDAGIPLEEVYSQVDIMMKELKGNV